MNDLLKELHDYVIEAQEITFNDDIRTRLGPSAALGEENAQHVQAYTFHYESLGNTIAGFLVAPAGDRSKLLPVIIFNRGGNKDFGITKPGMLFKHIAEMARWGYAVIGSQYPGNSLSEGHDGFGSETDIQSILDLYPLIQRLSTADEKRIGMLGESRGGMMTYLSLTKANWIKCAVTIAGAADLVRQTTLRPEMQNVFIETFGGSEEDKRQRSAVFWPEKFPDNVPILLMHSTTDWRVSPLDSMDLAAKLYEHKKPFSLMVYDSGDHGLSQYKKEWQGQAKNWFERHLN